MERLESAGGKLTEPAEEPGVKFENLIHFANSRWRLGQPKNSAQQLSSAALRQGWRVFYCAPESATPGIGSRRRNLRLLHPLGPIDPQAIQQSLADWELHPGNTLVMTSYASPSAARLLGHFAGQGYCCVHRQVDAFVEDPRLGSYSHRALAEICRQCQLITVSHPELRTSLPSHPCPVVDLRNGLDRRVFGPLPAVGPLPQDLHRGQLTLGFWGSFWGDRVDWALVRRLASDFPGWQWNFIGDLTFGRRPEDLPANVHLLGARHPRQLPLYARGFDVALVPFRQDLEFARLSNPIKVLEYLACGCPVVTPGNPSLLDYPAIFAYRSVEEAAEQIQAASRHRLDEPLRQQLVEQHSWDRRWQELLAHLSGVLECSAPPRRPE